MVDSTKVKKLKLSEYELGKTLGTGEKNILTKDHSVEFDSQKIKPQENMWQ